MVEKERGMHIKVLRSDGGGEYFSHEFSEYLQNQEIKENIHADVPLSKMGLQRGKKFTL